MWNIDLDYLCRTIGNLCGFPVRLYRRQDKVFYLDHARLERDPVLPYLDELFTIQSHIGYFITPIYHYYGIVRSSETRIILGPARQLPATKQQLRELAFLCDVPREGMDAFVKSMGMLSPLPLESLLQVLCALNYIMNGEKLGLEDITMSEPAQLMVQRQANKARESAMDAHEGDNHNTLAMEETLMHMIRKGDVPAMQAWISEAPAVHAGPMAADHLRQYRNTFIVSTTLAARAAIRGGMGINEALSLSDLLIRNCEAANDVQSILSMQASMMLTYAEEVRRVHMGKHPTPLAADVARYVQRHLSEVISADKMANELHLSRPHLSRQFKADTDMTLTDYILTQKCEEAAQLLASTDKQASAISAYLGFSSQSHFARVFKKYKGCTPKEYEVRAKRKS